MKTFLLSLILASTCAAANVAALLGGSPPAAGGNPANRTFYWSMEGTAPDQYPTDDTPQYFFSAARTTAQAYAGSYSLQVGDGTNTFMSATFDGPAATVVSSVTAEADDDVLTKTAHGMVDGTKVRMTSGTGFTGLTPLTVGYFVRDATPNTFKLSATAGGSAIDITADGTSGIFTWSVPEWTPINQGTIRGYARLTHSGSITGTAMICQITGKDNVGGDDEDTNEGIQIYINNVSEVRIRAYYNNAGANVQATASTTIVSDTWYPFEIKWRDNASPYLSITFNGVTATSATNPTFATTNWRHLLIGDDTSGAVPGLFIDEFEVYDIWMP